ncbi:hypothetical protein L1887_43424 [Cichorium endivia]|nr:hypothetical protein L1887_43424 [Cichorium endivia]
MTTGASCRARWEDRCAGAREAALERPGGPAAGAALADSAAGAAPEATDSETAGAGAGILLDVGDGLGGGFCGSLHCIRSWLLGGGIGLNRCSRLDGGSGGGFGGQQSLPMGRRRLRMRPRQPERERERAWVLPTCERSEPSSCQQPWERAWRELEP